MTRYYYPPNNEDFAIQFHSYLKLYSGIIEEFEVTRKLFDSLNGVLNTEENLNPIILEKLGGSLDSMVLYENYFEMMTNVSYLVDFNDGYIVLRFDEQTAKNLLECEEKNGDLIDGLDEFTQKVIENYKQ